MSLLNAEQTAKVKNAVKQKLADIGAYVDDQLSDYVMIMITNKKTEKQMTEDLELFLGGIKQSAEFSSWLHSYIKKITSTDSVISSSTSSSSRKQSTSKQSTSRKSTGSSTSASLVPQISNQHESDELAIQIDSNEFNDDFNTEETDKKKHNQSPKTRPDKKTVTSSSPSKSKPTKVEEPLKLKPQITPTKSSRDSAKQETIKSDQPVKSFITTPTKQVSTTTSTTISSKVIAVKQDDNEDELDKVDKTRLSSVIKISDRKYNVPKSMQPNKSILLKAVDDANKSSSNRPKSIADEKLAELRSRRFNTIEDDYKQQQRTSEYDRHQRHELTSTTTHKRLKKSMSPSEDKRQAVLNESSLDADFGQVSKTTSSMFLNTDRRQVQIETHKRIAVTDEHDNRIDADNLELETSQQLTKEPKFIVTLSGLNDENFLKKFSQTKTENKRTLDDMEDEENEMNQQEDDERMEATEEGDQMDMDEQKPKKILIRCTFWPQCEKGDLCPYLHPNKPCTTFPNCTFGQQCHYLHPSCRYDGFCTRLDCIYTHLIKKPTPPTQVLQPTDSNKETQSQQQISTTNETVSTNITATLATTTESPSKPTAPKVTINKIQSSTYINNTTSQTTAGGVTGEQMETSGSATKPPFLSSRRSASNLGYFKPSGFAFASNQYTLVNRAAAPAITTPCKFGNMCKNPKCFFTHPNIPQMSQLKWTAALQNTTNTQQINTSLEMNTSGTESKMN